MQKFSVHHALLRPIARQEQHLHWRFFCQSFIAALIVMAMLFGVKRSTAMADDPPPTATSTSANDGANRRGEISPVGASQPLVVSAAPGYCPSNGGSSEFERITHAILTPNGDGTMKLQLNVFIANPEGCVAGQECPTYEASPEHVNAWIDWNGDQQWDASERVMDKDLTGYSAINYAGTMTGISQFAIPATFTETTWLRANVGYLHDPNDACELSWQYGNVLDQPVRLKAPQITALRVAGSKDPNNPMTTYDVRLEAVVESTSDFAVTQVSWSGDLKPGTGNPYIYKPDKGTHGKKKIKATVTFKNKSSGAVGQVSKEFAFTLFFEKNGDDDGDGRPNWFAYWGVDGAVPGLTNPQIIYDATKGAGSYGAWSPTSDRVELGPAAAETHYPGGLTIERTIYGNARGIDAVAEVVAHELRHRTTIKVNWEAGGAWVGQADSDYRVPTAAYYDKLPNTYEATFGTDKTKTDSKDLEHRKSAVYKYYGDNEFDAIVAGHQQRGVAANDWANPGKQSNPSFVTAAAAEGASPTAASGLVTAASQFQTTAALLLPNLAQLTGSYTDAGIDLDNDGQYEALRITVGVNITATAHYQLVGWLQGSTGTNLAWAYTGANLSPGVQQVQLEFDGKLLRLLAENGPYTLAHVEIRTGDDGDVVDSADNAYTTTAYSATSFVAPPVTYTGVYADHGVDSNSNARFDALAIDVGVQVNSPGNYSLIGWLYTTDGSALPGAVATTSFNTAGTQTLLFDGKSIRWQRTNGPYTLRYLEVRNANQERVAFLTQAYTTTSAYPATEFEPGGAAELDPTAYRDRGIDLNSDGLYDSLRITTSISATSADLYQLSAELHDQAGQAIATIAKAINLHAGNNPTVTLDFPGGLIRQHGVDGPYQLAQVILTNEAGEVIDQQRLAATTQPYTATAFALPLLTLAGDFQDAAVDSDNNGHADQLNIVIPILSGNQGVVIAQARLVDKDDHEIAWVERDIAVTPGVVLTMTLPFSATQILSHGVDGPYLLQDLFLYHTGDASQALTNLSTYATASYRHTDLTIFTGSAATLALTATPTQRIADGTSTSAITVTVKDATGNLLPNQTVQFTTTTGTLTASGGNTDLHGQLAVNLRAPTSVGKATVTASTANISQTTTVTFVAGPPAFMTIIITPTLLVADGKGLVTVRARVTDALGNPVAGQLVNFTTSLGSIAPSAQTDADGMAVAPLTVAASGGIAQVNATLGALQVTARATFVQPEHQLYLPLIHR